MSGDERGDGPGRIEDYALIGDCRTGALVGSSGSIDWLCWPRFDSGACLAALLGTSRNGRWAMAPVDADARSSRSYRGDTMILETVFETADGAVCIVDLMPSGRDDSSVIRRVEGRRGRVAMKMSLTMRFDFGSSTPWLTTLEDGAVQHGVGPHAVVLRSDVPLGREKRVTTAEFAIDAGQRVDFVLTWGASHLPPAAAFDVETAIRDTEAFWLDWSGRCTYRGPWRAQVQRSLLTLKALTYRPTGGIVAALTTSLPEDLGGSRNWDYRYGWLRDSILSLTALTRSGYRDEAEAWLRWLRRAVAGTPEELQIMYGIGGERRLVEWQADWLPGYEGSRPVNIGNAAYTQLQIDVYGEVLGTLYLAREAGFEEPEHGWTMQVQFVEYLESIWDQPDDGMWEVRGGRRHFTSSKIMAWLAIDRAIRSAEQFGLDGPLDRWKALRERMHREICDKGYDAGRNTFTQSYGSSALDASLFALFKSQFLPVDDPRVVGTIEAIEKELIVDGLVLRYRASDGSDGLAGGEGAFLACSFWLVEAYATQGRDADARALFERLIALCNDVGLMAEEYDTKASRQVGNFPQAFSHLSLVNAALVIDEVARSRGADRATPEPRAV